MTTLARKVPMALSPPPVALPSVDLAECFLVPDQSSALAQESPKAKASHMVSQVDVQTVS
jgi:hypothetical protein